MPLFKGHQINRGKLQESLQQVVVGNSDHSDDDFVFFVFIAVMVRHRKRTERSISHFLKHKPSAFNTHGHPCVRKHLFGQLFVHLTEHIHELLDQQPAYALLANCRVAGSDLQDFILRHPFGKRTVHTATNFAPE